MAEPWNFKAVKIEGLPLNKPGKVKPGKVRLHQRFGRGNICL